MTTATMTQCSFCKKTVTQVPGGCWLTMECHHVLHFTCMQVLLSSGKLSCKTCSTSTGVSANGNYQSWMQNSPLVLGHETFRHATLLERMRTERKEQVSANTLELH